MRMQPFSFGDVIRFPKGKFDVGEVMTVCIKLSVEYCCVDWVVSSNNSWMSLLYCPSFVSAVGVVLMEVVCTMQVLVCSCVCTGLSVMSFIMFVLSCFEWCLFFCVSDVVALSGGVLDEWFLSLVRCVVDVVEIFCAGDSGSIWLVGFGDLIADVVMWLSCWTVVVSLIAIQLFPIGLCILSWVGTSQVVVIIVRFLCLVKTKVGDGIVVPVTKRIPWNQVFVDY
jgi:hypothetical protein